MMRAAMRPRRLFASTGLIFALSAFAAAGCSPRGESSAPAATPPPAAQAEFAAGTKVEVQRNGKWLAATVVQPFGDRWLVTYEGWGPEWNEQVGSDRLRAVQVTYGAGDKVLVQMANRLAAAEIVMQAGPQLWRVHYDGYGMEVGEIVGPARLRRPFTAAAAKAIGDAVGVEFQGQVLAGKVLAIAAANRFVVRFPAFGPDYDQEVTADRFRPVPAETAGSSPPPALAAAGPKAPGGPGTAPGPGSASSGFAVNDQVLVSQRSGWLLATVHAASPNGTYKVHYEGAASGDDEMSGDRLLKAPQPLKGQKYQANQNVYVEWHGMFVGGKVLKESDPGTYKIRYEGLGPDADEVLPAKRLRPR